MVKDKSVVVRVSVEDHNLVKSLEGNFTEIWRIGFEKWCQSYPDILQKKASEYQQLYVQCISKLGKVYTMSVQKNVVLDDLYKLYVSQGRDVNHPSGQDKSWVKGRLGKLDNGSRVSVSQFFSYAQKQYQSDRQKRLEVDE